MKTNEYIEPCFQQLSLDKRIALREGLAAYLERRAEIVFAYLHGSFPLDIPFRDIDLSLYLDAASVPRFRYEEYRERLCDELSDSFHQVFDISILNVTPDSFSVHVFKEGKLLFSRDDVLRTDLIEACSLASIKDEALSRQYLREIVF